MEEFKALLKKIPGDFLDEIIDSSNLPTLLSRDEGIRLFESFLNGQQHFAKYWNFCKLVEEVKRAEDEGNRKELALNCWKKHISISADPDDKLAVGLNRNSRDKIREEVENNCYGKLFDLEKEARDHLDQKVCYQLVIILKQNRK